MPAAIRVTLRGGTTVGHQIDEVRGGAKRAINREEILGKFYNNCEGVLASKKAEQIVEQIRVLEHQDSVMWPVSQCH